MKTILYMFVFALSVVAHAESDLETDDSFFKEVVIPHEDDDLDRAHKKNELVKSTENQKTTESKVKDEFSSTAQGVMSATEARMMDERIVAENKRRQAAILTSLKISAGPVSECVAKNAKNFQGTHATLIWMIGADGKVMETALKSSDIESNEIQKCIYGVAANLDFSAARTDLILKKSKVEYTYKFKKKVVAKATARPQKKPARRTASER